MSIADGQLTSLQLIPQSTDEGFLVFALFESYFPELIKTREEHDFLMQRVVVLMHDKEQLEQAHAELVAAFEQEKTKCTVLRLLMSNFFSSFGGRCKQPACLQNERPHRLTCVYSATTGS